MVTIDSIPSMQSWADNRRKESNRIGFVPTMGALHDGHLSLVEFARERADVVVASIYVNPRQFGPHEDFARYPRMPERDAELLEHAGVDALFAPADKEMYPSEVLTEVGVRELGSLLEGRSRPTHFVGVTLVVAKLFHAVKPHVAVFGRKDAQQVVIIRRMTDDLNFGIEIAIAPTLRETDGLAMSSRNAYLSIEDRRKAVVLSTALRAGFDAWRGGERVSVVILERMRSIAGTEPGVELDYLEIVDQDTLLPVAELRPHTLAAGAIIVGKTRLIDNWWITREGVSEF